MFGLVLFGVGLALMVIADLGLSPWDVLHQRIGIGTIANAIVIGLVLDGMLLILPDTLENMILRWLAMLGGVVLVAIGSGFYIGAGLGPGPRDGLMTGLARRGIPIAWNRAGIEITVLVAGWLLGGTVGVGTLVFAFGMGPLVQFFLERLSVIPTVSPANE
jgi:uncharacterized membrane protein YczE